jgi:hypothetical protein
LPPRSIIQNEPRSAKHECYEYECQEEDQEEEACGSRLAREEEFAIMLIGLFLLYLAAFTAVFYSIAWLSDFLTHATATSALTFAAAAGGVTAAAILARGGRGGITIVVAVLAFWSLLLLGADGATVATTLDAAALTLIAAAAATLSDALLRRL